MIKFKQTAQTSFILRYFSLFLFFYFSGFTLNAQPLNMDTAVKPTELKLYKFNPKDQPKGKGWLNITNVKQVKDTAYYFCKGLSIYSPAAVIVASKDKSIPLQASLHKWNWKETSKKGSTGTNGTWMEKFKTENDFGLMVVAPLRPAEYVITVWVGAEADVELPADFKAYDADSQETADNKSNKESFFKKYLLYIIIGILGLAVLFLIIKRKK
ncbi:MAG: hypothetical protein WBC06_11800 [Chitinophagaceae bacterium]